MPDRQLRKTEKNNNNLTHFTSHVDKQMLHLYYLNYIYLFYFIVKVSDNAKHSRYNIKRSGMQ